MSENRGAKWPGRGFVRMNSDGSVTYWVRKMVKGKQYEFSLHTGDVRVAERLFRQFEKDPEAYLRGTEATGLAPDAVVLDDVSLRRHIAWLKGRDEGCSAQHVKDRECYLEFWKEKLAGKDLRRLTLKGDILPHIEDEHGKKFDGWDHKVKHLKAFYGWLRGREEKIHISEDPIRGALTVPKKKARVKKARDFRELLAIRDHLDPKWRDLYDVRIGTGWHWSELELFATKGEVRPPPYDPEPGVVAVLWAPKHKNGGECVSRVTQPVKEAAERVLIRGRLPAMVKHFRKALATASAKAGLMEPIKSGVLRHSVGHFAIEVAKESPEKVAAAFQHGNVQMLKDHYARFAIPAKSPTPL